MDFQIDPAELHQFPDRLFRRELQHPENLRELIEDLDSELAARLDFDRAQLWQREHTFDDWRQFERDLPFLIPYCNEPDEHLLLCLLLEHQSKADRLMPLRVARPVPQNPAGHLQSPPQTMIAPQNIPEYGNARSKIPMTSG